MVNVTCGGGALLLSARVQRCMGYWVLGMFWRGGAWLHASFLIGEKVPGAAATRGSAETSAE